MDGNSSQSGSTAPVNLEFDDSISLKLTLHENMYNNDILHMLEQDGFITPDEKVEELSKNLTESKHLYALILLFENTQNQFSPKVLQDTLATLADPTPFDYYAEQSIARLELHLRTLIANLEKIWVTPMRLSTEFRDKIYNCLAKFAEIYQKTTQVIKEEIIIKKQNYNIDFLLIHLRDTLKSLRDDEAYYQEAEEPFMTASNITPEILSKDNSYLSQVRQSLSFKFPVASYYIDWRIMLIYQHNLFIWSECSEKIISRKICELALMESIWSILGREWKNAKSILDPQTKFDEISNKVTKALKNTFPDVLWFGMLDLAQKLIQRSTQKATYGLCYYLAIESLSKAPSNVIQFKSIELLLHLQYIDNRLFSVIEIDFDRYTQILLKNNSVNSLEKFHKLLTFVKEKAFEDVEFLNYNVKKEKRGDEKNLNQNTHLIEEQTSNSKILDVIADEMTCPISNEPEDQLCILKCQHTLSLNNLKKLRQKVCPVCRKQFDDDIRYLSQVSIHKNLYSKFVESGHILPLIELEDSTNNQYDNLSLQSGIFKKKQPYQYIIEELYEKNYEKAESCCREFLKSFPKSYAMRCILAYICRCLENYEQAHFYLTEAVNLKPKKSFAYFIQGEVYLRQYEYENAINSLKISINYKAVTNKIYMLLGDCYFLGANLCNNSNDKNNSYLATLDNYLIALKDYPYSYLCLKKCAYIYNKQKKYLNSLEMLDRLLNMNKGDSLILCYYGEILKKLGRYNEAISYFTDANLIDPENIHILNRRAISYYALQEYYKALSDLDKATQLNPLNSLTYYYKGLTYYAMEHIYDAVVAFEKCIEIDPNDNLAKIQLYFIDLNHDTVIEINQIPNISDNKSLLFVRCKIYIELGEYDKALLDFNRLFELYNEDISFIYLLQNYLNYWSYLCDYYKISDNDYRDIGIIENFIRYMYKVKKVYFISSISNILLKSDINSLSGRSFDAKDVHLNLKLPKLLLPYVKSQYLYIVWKICVKNILSKNANMNFIVNMGVESSLYYSLPDQHQKKEHRLNYDDLSKLVGLGWIEYTVPINIKSNKFDWVQPSVIANGPFIDMQIDYVRFMQFERDPIYFPKMGHLLPIYKFHPNILSSINFPKKETENLITPDDVIYYFP
ncbi:unnamed protein product [Rhizophagus irregularis]|nr:unnamed protein product [Rhizophagus irregularis]